MKKNQQREKPGAVKGGALLVAVFLALGIGIFLLLRPSGFVRLYQGNTTQAGKVSVVTSFYPTYYFASRVGGDLVTVTNITPAGAEPHDYEPTAQDVARMEDSRLVLLLGGGLESWGGRIATNLAPERTAVITVGQDLMTDHVMEEGERIADPHVWLSPVLAKQMAEKIAEAYVNIDPANADSYRKNAEVLKNDLDSLDADYRKALTSCAMHEIVTSHAAFGYLAREYDFIQVPISGLSPDAEPSPKEMADIAAFVRQRKIGILFFESLVSPKLSETIAQETGAKTLVLDPIEGLQEDAIAAGQDYLSVMRNNLANLRAALQCHM